MKKQLLTLLIVLGLGISAKGIDPFCVKNHESVLLTDHQWHTLTYSYGKFSDNWSTAKIKIRQEDNGIYYEFKDANEDAVLRFYNWLSRYGYYNIDWNGARQTPISKEGSDYVGSFIGYRYGNKIENFVPYIDKNLKFLGIDLFLDE